MKYFNKERITYICVWIIFICIATLLFKEYAWEKRLDVSYKQSIIEISDKLDNIEVYINE